MNILAERKSARSLRVATQAPWTETRVTKQAGGASATLQALDIPVPLRQAPRRAVASLAIWSAARGTGWYWERRLKN